MDYIEPFIRVDKFDTDYDRKLLADFAVVHHRHGKRLQRKTRRYDSLVLVCFLLYHFCAPVAAIATDENADTCSDIEITASKILKDNVLITRNAKFLVSGRG